jgi:hypothetical protein
MTITDAHEELQLPGKQSILAFAEYVRDTDMVVSAEGFGRDGWQLRRRTQMHRRHAIAVPGSGT